MHPANLHKIYARYNDDTIRVYQAYGDAIANEALQKGTFGDSFKLERMTWIKPSFFWMMYRSGWGTKEGQTRVLAIDMKRTGFDEILSQAVQSSFSKEAVHGKSGKKPLPIPMSVVSGTRSAIFTETLWNAVPFNWGSEAWG